MSLLTNVHLPGGYDDGYQIKHCEYGIAIFGQIPVDDFSGLIGMWEPQGYKLIDYVIANDIKATVVIVKDQESADKWKESLNIRLDNEDWLKSGDTGISSKTIYAILEDKWHILHRGCDDFDIPADAWDFGRCYRLVKRYPHYEKRLSEVAEKCKKWKPLVDNWSKLCTAYEQEGQPDKDGFITVDKMPKFQSLLDSRGW